MKDPMMKLGAVMITCSRRAEVMNQTLNALKETDWDAPVLVIDDRMAIEDKGLVVDRPQSRQELVSLYALQRGLEEGWDVILFLEDDLVFNQHLKHNLLSWYLLGGEAVRFGMGSLYNPNVAEIARVTNTAFIADPNAVYGSQAFVLPRSTAEYIVSHWWDVEGMQDIKISRLASRIGYVYYHLPSLVQHVGAQSMWTEDNRFHQCPDFSMTWKATSTEGKV